MEVSAPSQPRILADRGGLVIAQSGPDILVIDRGGGGWQIATFVLAILTLVCGGFGVIALFTAEVPLAVSAVLLIVGLAAGVGALGTAGAIRRRRRAPVSDFTPVAVFDRARRVYRDGAGRPVAPLDQVRFECRAQLTSSSAMLVAVTPTGTRILKRGNPFGGSVGNLDRVLTATVFGP